MATSRYDKTPDQPRGVNSYYSRTKGKQLTQKKDK